MKDAILATLRLLLFAASLISLGAFPAHAQKTNLVCDLSSPGNNNLWDVTLDEASQTVSAYVRKTGYSNRQQAVFTTTYIMWRSGRYGEYQLDRTTGRLRLFMGGKDMNFPGQCSKQVAPATLF